MNISEFSRKLGISEQEVRYHVSEGDQYGSCGSSRDANGSYSFNEWMDSACSCDLLYGYICPIHSQSIGEGNTEAFRWTNKLSDKDKEYTKMP